MNRPVRSVPYNRLLMQSICLQVHFRTVRLFFSISFIPYAVRSFIAFPIFVIKFPYYKTLLSYLHLYSSFKTVFPDAPHLAARRFWDTDFVPHVIPENRTLHVQIPQWRQNPHQSMQSLHPVLRSGLTLSQRIMEYDRLQSKPCGHRPIEPSQKHDFPHLSKRLPSNVTSYTSGQHKVDISDFLDHLGNFRRCISVLLLITFDFIFYIIVFFLYFCQAVYLVNYSFFFDTVCI